MAAAFLRRYVRSNSVGAMPVKSRLAAPTKTVWNRAQIYDVFLRKIAGIRYL